jgi:hypothetical protein
MKPKPTIAELIQEGLKVNKYQNATEAILYVWQKQGLKLSIKDKRLIKKLGNPDTIIRANKHWKKVKPYVTD